MSRDDLYNFMKSKNIFGRRYFFPLISQFPIYRGLPSSNPANLQIAEKTSLEVICLPIYPDLEKSIAQFIVDIIARN